MNYRAIFIVTLLSVACNVSRSVDGLSSEKVLIGHTVDVKCAAFSPDETVLASAGYSSEEGTRWEAEIKLWDVASGRERATLKSQKGVVFVAFSPDGKTLAAGGYYAALDKEGEPKGVSELKLWDVPTAKERASFKVDLETLLYSAFAFSPDGKLIAIGSEKGLRRWGVTETSELPPITGPAPKALAFSPDSKLLAVASSRDGKDEFQRLLAHWEVKLIDARTDKELAYFKGKGDDAYINSVVFSADGKFLAAGSADGNIRLWDLQTKTETTVFDESSYSIGRVTCIALSPDHKVLASANGNGVIALWDTSSRQQRARVERKGEWINWVTFSRDGKMLASASSARTIRLFDVAGLFHTVPASNSG